MKSLINLIRLAAHGAPQISLKGHSTMKGPACQQLKSPLTASPSIPPACQSSRSANWPAPCSPASIRVGSPPQRGGGQVTNTEAAFVRIELLVAKIGRKIDRLCGVTLADSRTSRRKPTQDRRKLRDQCSVELKGSQQ